MMWPGQLRGACSLLNLSRTPSCQQEELQNPNDLRFVLNPPSPYTNKHGKYAFQFPDLLSVIIFYLM